MNNHLSDNQSLPSWYLHNKTIFFVLMLLCLGAYETFSRLLEVTGGLTPEGISQGGVLYVIMCTLCLGLVIKHFSLLESHFCRYVIFYACCFALMSFVHSTNLFYLFTNILWCFATLGGFVLGKIVRGESRLDVVKWPLLLMIVLVSLKIPEALVKVSAISVSDCFFICAIFVPMVGLLKRGKLRNVIFIFLLVLCFFSLKRTLMITSILSIVIFLSPQIKTKKLLFAIAMASSIILFLFVVNIDNLVLFGEVMDRVNSISDNGGSGREDMYKLLWGEIIHNFSVMDIMIGKGPSTLSDHLGMNAHMDILQILYSFGVVTLIFYFGIIVSVLHKIRKTAKYAKTLTEQDQLTSLKICLMNFLIIGNLNCLIVNPPLVIPMMFILGMLIGILSSNKPICNNCRYESFSYKS